MKCILKTTLLALITILGTSCTTGYWTDRGRDAADVFTLSAGVGIGGKVRLGPLQTGILFQSDQIGLRGGTFGSTTVWNEEKDGGFTSYSADMQFVWSGVESFDTGKCIPILGRRNKRYTAIHTAPFFHRAAPILLAKKKDYFPKGEDVASYYTQLEAVVALGPSIRLGFNPGELLDFLLGWVGIDIYNDDLEPGKQRIEQADDGPDGPNP